MLFIHFNSLVGIMTIEFNYPNADNFALCRVSNYLWLVVPCDNVDIYNAPLT